MRPADLRFCDEIRALAGWNQRIGAWERFLRFSPDGCFVAVLDGRVAGTVTTIQYGSEVGWIGMLLVHPDSLGQGIGKALLTRAISHLHERKVASIKLDATPAGEALYRKMGFREEWSITRFKMQGAIETLTVPGTVRAIIPADVPTLAEMDAVAFGVEREGLIEALLATCKQSVAAVEEGRIDAFGLLRPGSSADYFGPVVARTADAAIRVIATLRLQVQSRPVYWDVPLPNLSAIDLATKLGFKAERNLLRMYMGESRSGKAANYFGIADPSLG